MNVCEIYGFFYIVRARDLYDILEHRVLCSRIFGGYFEPLRQLWFWYLFVGRWTCIKNCRNDETLKVAARMVAVSECGLPTGLNPGMGFLDVG